MADASPSTRSQAAGSKVVVPGSSSATQSRPSSSPASDSPRANAAPVITAAGRVNRSTWSRRSRVAAGSTLDDGWAWMTGTAPASMTPKCAASSGLPSGMTRSTGAPRGTSRSRSANVAARRHRSP